MTTKQERELKIKSLQAGAVIRPTRQTCPICFGMGVKEIRNGDDTIDCPNRSCENGYIKIK